MKLFTTIRFAFAALLVTGFLISAFIILFSYSSGSTDNAVKENLLDNRAAITGSSVEFLSETNSNRGLTDTLADSNIKQFPEKSEEVISITIIK